MCKKTLNFTRILFSSHFRHMYVRCRCGNLLASQLMAIASAITLIHKRTHTLKRFDLYLMCEKNEKNETVQLRIKRES